MISTIKPAEERVAEALANLSYGIPKPLRDLMVTLVQDAEADCALAELPDAHASRPRAVCLFPNLNGSGFSGMVP